MSIQKNKKEQLIEEEEQPITKKKKKVLSQKVLENLALGRRKIDNLELKRKEREEEKNLNKQVKKVNKILKEHFPESEIPDTVVKPVLKRKNEKNEEIKEEYVQETKKNILKEINLYST